MRRNITSHQSPITNHQSPVTNHQSPVTNHQSRITNHQSPITLEEQFRLILEPTSLETGMSGLAGWFAEVYESGIKPLIKFAQQCGRWFEGLMNYFKHGVTNALSESINSKISLMIKLANGFRNREYFMLKIHQQCRDLG